MKVWIILLLLGLEEIIPNLFTKYYELTSIVIFVIILNIITFLSSGEI